LFSIDFTACPVFDAGLANTKWERAMMIRAPVAGFGFVTLDLTLEFTINEAKFIIAGASGGATMGCQAAFGVLTLKSGGKTETGNYVVFGNSLEIDGFSAGFGGDYLNGDWSKK
jgi:hypothetical protein